MDIDSAKRFKTHLEQVVKELSAALLISRASSDAESFSNTRRSIGNIIAEVDTILYETIYVDHPELNDLKK